MAQGIRKQVHRWALTFTRPRDPEPLPVTFDRRRVYVLPTRFGLFYAILVATMLLGGLNYNNNPALLLALLLGGTGLASLVAAQLQLSGLSITTVDAEPVPAGQMMLLHVHAKAVDGRTRRGLQVALDPNYDSPVLLDLPLGHGQAQLLIPTSQRGWLELPRVRIDTRHPLGLARAWSHVWPQTPLLVYPCPETDGPPLPEGSGEDAKARIHPSGEDLHHLRTYRHGDSRRTIAWKPSARHESLLVREYQQPAGADIVLDWHSLAPLPHEARISRLARWVDEAERDGRRYRLALPVQPSIGPSQGPGHRHDCLRALALMPDG
ncbi:DUF58 domain-containing protein [Novilysobacter antarcticus]|uniref:DUF58 domain-containing protein n=1 Tax=Novilysobacter antarcticus TaxID=2862543 RepID=UPI001C995623|nr:DUF58 domain-containing protein [Lysobacter antarcticus]